MRRTQSLDALRTPEPPCVPHSAPGALALGRKLGDVRAKPALAAPGDAPGDAASSGSCPAQDDARKVAKPKLKPQGDKKAVARKQGKKPRGKEESESESAESDDAGESPRSGRGRKRRPRGDDEPAQASQNVKKAARRQTWRSPAAAVVEKPESLETVAELGKGGFGTVELRKCAGAAGESDEFFAIKTVSVKQGDKLQEELLRQMQREVQLQRSFNHRNIVRSFWHETTEVEADNGRVLRLEMAMEHMAGGSVSDLLSEHRQGLDEKVLRRYTQQLVLGVAHLHNRLCVHRDLKCANLLLSADRSVLKIGDFGLAVRLESADEVGVAAGTYEWQAPEILLKNMQGLPADVWSLGCSVWEMASADFPWKHQCKGVTHDGGQTKDKTRQTILKTLRDKVGKQKMAPQLPKKLSAMGRQFVRTCLAHNAQLRPTAVQLLDADFVDPPGAPSARVRKRSVDTTPTNRKRTRDLNADLALL